MDRLMDFLEDHFVLAIATIVAINMIFWSVVVFVALHFIMKWW